MIPFWHRREVFMGFDIDQLSRVRDALSAAGIPYLQRSGGHTLRSRMGSFGENSAFAALNYVYVHKDDLDRAREALRISPIR